MQTDFVSAILVSHNAPEYFSRTLSAIKQQPIKELIVVETGESTSADFFNAPNASLAQALNLAVTKISQATQWLWILHDDSAPLEHSLSELLKVAELSPSVGVIGPKQVDWSNHRSIEQLGLTITPTGALFSLVNGELDQSQHDAAADVLAVGTAGMLVKLDAWQKLNGLADGMPPLAADVDFSIRARLAGFRVVVAPQARVAHAMLSIHNQRERGWLRVKAKSAIRRAEIQLRISYAPLGLAVLYWFFLPALTAGRIVWRLWNKRPDRVLGEVGAAAWAYFTVAARFANRRSTSASGRRALRSLYASGQMVKDEKRQNAEAEEIEARLEAHAQLAERDQSSLNTEQLLLGVGSTSKSFVAAGGLWFVFGLLALSFAWLPTGEAIRGGGSIPLSSNWFELFRKAGASWQSIGNGFAAPADPFVWVLTMLGSLTFWAPSLAITILVFAAKAIAFFGAFKAVGLFTKKTWVKNVAALSYVLLPMFTQAQTELRIPSIIAIVVLPLLVVTVSKVALFGVELSVRSKQQIWTWVGLSGLLLAVEVACAPNTALILIPAMIVVLIARAKRIGYLIWLALPTAVIFGPLAIYLLFHGPLNLLADPGVPQSTPEVAGWQLLLGVTENPLGYWQFGFFVAIPLLVALLALLTRRRGVALLSLGLGLLSLLAARFALGLQFNAVGVVDSPLAQVNGSPYALLAIWGLALVCSLAVTLDAIQKRTALRLAATALIALFVLPSAAITALSQPPATWGSARVMPAIIDAEAKAGTTAKVLVITPESDFVSTALVNADGIQLEDASVAYRSTAIENPGIAQLTADLVSGGNKSLSSELNLHQINYLLVPKSSELAAADVAAALDSVEALEAAGETDYGKIWRVRDSIANSPANKSPWSITKVIQLTILVAFILLAIPTSGKKRAVGRSEIFVDSGESND